MVLVRGLLVIFLFALASLGSGTGRATEVGPQVVTQKGVLRGVDSDGVMAFKGIPFAAPPVGSLRWRAPQPVASWAGVRDATQYGHDCMQRPFPSDAAPLGTAPAEDCLYANVWRPAHAKGKLPVMVWIYGGGFVNGGASPPTYTGAALAKQGLVFVSFNYRVGRFGTFAIPALTKEDADRGLVANYGYMDQLAALHWVQSNISAFGGDPAKVTVVGESAGGISIHTLLTSPLAKGLFRAAVIQSGGPVSLGDPTLKAAEAEGVAFAASKGIDANDPQVLAKLRALSADEVTDGLNMAALFSPQPGVKTFSSPIIDGKLAVDNVAAYRQHRFKHVPIMVGATSGDLGGQKGPMIVGARMVAGLLAEQGVPVYYYRFSYVAPSVPAVDSAKGAGHASDIPYFLDTVDVKYGEKTTLADRNAARFASGYLANFVKTNDPNGPGLPAWKAYAGASKPLLNITADGVAVMEKDPLDTAAAGINKLP